MSYIQEARLNGGAIKRCPIGYRRACLDDYGVITKRKRRVTKKASKKKASKKYNPYYPKLKKKTIYDSNIPHIPIIKGPDGKLIPDETQYYDYDIEEYSRPDVDHIIYNQESKYDYSMPDIGTYNYTTPDTILSRDRYYYNQEDELPYPFKLTHIKQGKKWKELSLYKKLVEELKQMNTTKECWTQARQMAAVLSKFAFDNRDTITNSLFNGMIKMAVNKMKTDCPPHKIKGSGFYGGVLIDYDFY